MSTRSVSSKLITSYDLDCSNLATTVESKSECVVVNFEEHTTLPVKTPAKYQTIADLVAELSVDEAFHSKLEVSRAWIADEFYGKDGDTVRTMRLRNGWSQAQLAKRLETSQPHVARIERGKENLQMSTCRKLCLVFSIDMNTLDAMLQRQEAIFVEKQK